MHFQFFIHNDWSVIYNIETQCFNERIVEHQYNYNYNQRCYKNIWWGQSNQIMFFIELIVLLLYCFQRFGIALHCIYVVFQPYYYTYVNAFFKRNESNLSTDQLSGTHFSVHSRNVRLSQVIESFFTVFLVIEKQQQRRYHSKNLLWT